MQKQPAIVDSRTQPKEIVSFFQVTSYLKGQISEIRTGGKTPIKFLTFNNKTDSVWLKMNNLDTAFADFLSPDIDSGNLVALFTEKKFLDQTINAITLTYDPIKTLPDNFYLTHWDVYIDPVTGMVRRIYLIKELPGRVTKQLTWNTGKSCTIVTIADDINGKSFVERKVAIKWDY